MVGATLASARIEGEDDADMGRRHAEEFLSCCVAKDHLNSVIPMKRMASLSSLRSRFCFLQVMIRVL
jgi:hypothetical protein